MLLGKVRDALRLINGDGVGGALSLYDFIPPGPNSQNTTPHTVFDVLRSKHPSPQQASEETLVDRSSEAPYPVIYERIDAKCIRSAALKTFGAGGPSRTDAKRLCSSFVHPDGIRPLLACCLIALDKKPGVCPIDVSEIPRRIIAKAILSVLRYDVMEAAGPLQLSAGQIAGIEAAIHAVRSTFECERTQGVLLVDASNVFNALNRSTALLNIRNICP